MLWTSIVLHFRFIWTLASSNLFWQIKYSDNEIEDLLEESFHSPVCYRFCTSGALSIHFEQFFFMLQLLREITHENVVKLVNVHINHADMSLYLAFDYAEHDLYVSIIVKVFIISKKIQIYTFKFKNVISFGTLQEKFDETHILWYLTLFLCLYILMFPRN